MTFLQLPADLSPGWLKRSFQFWFGSLLVYINRVGGAMKAILIAAAGMLAIMAIAPASAADIVLPGVSKERPPMPPPPPVIPTYNWTGLYIGGNVGGGWARADFANSATGTAGGVPLPTNTNSGAARASGIIGGGQIGFNYEFPANWVLGMEADIDAANITGSVSGCVATAAGVVGSCATNSIRFQDFGTVRGRFGYAFNNVLLYGTGGWAYGERNTTSTVTCAGPGCPVGSSLPFAFNSPSDTIFLSGWTAGAGLEWGFLRNWTLRIEYLHLQFNGVGENFGFTGTVTGVPIVSNVHNTTNNGIDIARVGVSYLFNWERRY